MPQNNYQKDIDALRQKQRQLEMRIAKLEKASLPIEEEPIQTETTSESQNATSGNRTGGIIMIVIGALLCLSFYGIVFGIIFIIIGSVILNKNKSSSEDTQVEEENEENTPKTKTKSAKAAKQSKEEPSSSIEAEVGMKWFARLGILALVIGMVFFIKYSFERGWISYLAIIIIGIVFGISLVVLGKLASFKKELEYWSHIIMGGGIAITYFSIFAAYNFTKYRLAIGINQTTDIVLLIIVATLATLIAIKENSKIIFSESYFLALVTCILSKNLQTLALIYIALLSVALVAIVIAKKWNVIGIAGVVATYLTYYFVSPTVYYYGAINAKLATISIAFTTIYFAAFLFQSTYLSLSNKDEILGMHILNGVLYFLSTYFILDIHFHEFRGAFCLALGVLYLAIAYFMPPQSSKIKTISLYIGLFFLTFAIGLEVNQNWMATFWSLEALLVAISAYKIKQDNIRYSSYAISFVAAFKAIVFDLTSIRPFYSIGINTAPLISALACVAALYASAWLFRKEKSYQKESVVFNIQAWVGTGILTALLFLELGKHQAWITAILAASIIAIYLVSKLESKLMAFQALALSVVLVIKLLVSDLRMTETLMIPFGPSVRILSFVITASTFYFIAHYLQIRRDKIEKDDLIVPESYSWTATGLAFLLILLEAEKFWVSVWWAMLAIVLLAIGFVLNRKHLRIQAILLFAITIFKVFLYDTIGLDTIYRTISFMVLGVILLIASFVYAKYKDDLKDLI